MKFFKYVFMVTGGLTWAVGLMMASVFLTEALGKLQGVPFFLTIEVWTVAIAMGLAAICAAAAAVSIPIEDYQGNI